MRRVEHTPEESRLIRRKYEHGHDTVAVIARDHHMSVGTLQNRVTAGHWRRRRPPIPREDPLPIDGAAPLLLAAPQDVSLAPMHADTAPPLPIAPDAASPGENLPGDPDTPTALRLQGAVARVLAAIEAIVAKIGAGRTAESDRSARALAALTRTLRELNTLQGQYEEPAADDDSPADIDEVRLSLVRKIDALVAARGGGARDDAEPQGA
jgi:hypothetical protein